MLSEEEKKAIEYAKSLVALFDKGIPLKYLEEENDMVKKLLNLITKLQKENEILKRAFDKQTADMSNNLLELRQKDKQIDLMARAFKQDDARSVEEIKLFYERKVEDDNSKE